MIFFCRTLGRTGRCFFGNLQPYLSAYLQAKPGAFNRTRPGVPTSISVVDALRIMAITRTRRRWREVPL